MSSLGKHPRRLEAAWSGADHDSLDASASGGGDELRDVDLPPRRRVLDAHRLEALVESVDAERCSDTDPDAVCFTAFELGDDVGVGDVGPGHACEIDQSRRDSVAR